ncbi:hypothetical protein KHA93_08010 [Bacillus sp. FJAT-49732]|uniref:Uncharacterized protein n=1 Tax=Lederbergia citrisecunda TaxID=2833583 RepID=A0A942TP98_9BACI|nr:hypothetical protein [Lederbergia citrisecunda]MBS4199597.1 hypothetical protein [Lederbergia citrisecunda]
MNFFIGQLNTPLDQTYLLLFYLEIAPDTILVLLEKDKQDWWGEMSKII